LAKLKVHTDNVYDAAFSSDGQRIITASRATTRRGLEDLNQRIVGYPSRSYCQRQHILTVSEDRRAIVWVTANGHLLTKLEGNTSDVL
jgi:WD40 repeat protein